MCRRQRCAPDQLTVLRSISLFSNRIAKRTSYVSSWCFRSRCTKAGRVPSITVMLSVLVLGSWDSPTNRWCRSGVRLHTTVTTPGSRLRRLRQEPMRQRPVRRESRQEKWSVVGNQFVEGRSKLVHPMSSLSSTQSRFIVGRVYSHPCSVMAFIPIYPNALNCVPEPPRASRMWSILINGLGASRGATTRLENR